MMLLAKPAEQFRPTVTYDPDGDCVEFLARPDSFYAERVDDLVTVYYSHQTGDVVGSQIKGVSKFCKSVLEKMPGFRIEIRDGRVSLEHILRAKLWFSDLAPENLPSLTYQKLICLSEDAGAEAQLCLERT